MSTFIDKLRQAVLEKYSSELGKICIVFPSKRACAFMEDQFKQNLPKASWSPTLVAIEDFVPQLHRATLLDPVSLTFELFPIYHEAFPEESFDQFYAWGQLMIADFDEIDRHLIDGDKIFQNLAQLKTVDVTIDSWLNENGELSAHQKEYLKFWELLGKFYENLYKKLKIQGMSSPGRALRDLATQISREKPELPWKRVIFAGFNALSPAEELLFSSLMKWELAECYWDLDEWYTEHPIQEAGKFFRALRNRWELVHPELKNNWSWIENRLAGTSKKITFTAVPKRVGQAKAAGLLLEEIGPEIRPESVAVVLPDENLLFPVLHSLPESLNDINVTMGYPLRNTPLYGLVDAILGLHENAERLRPGDANEPVYYFRDISAILRHPYIQSLASAEGREIMREITQENMIYVAPKYFTKFEDDGLLHFLFSPWKNLQDAIRYLLELFLRLKKGFESKQSEGLNLPTVEAEILFQFHSLTQKLRDKLGKYLGERDLQIFRRLYKEVIIAAGIPFAGEPLKGIQIMGMLETRVLDFEHLILLSANEGILPPKAQQSSLLPYGIRKAFQLPTFEEKDAIYAYHFYRLLQGAKTVNLIYDSESDGLGGGEKSRFATQIEAELAVQNPDLEIEHTTFSFPSDPEATRPIIVQKDETLLKILQDFASDSGFSPSGLNTYMGCGLQFYFRYLLKIKEKELPEESMEDNTFGLVLHGTLEQLYADFVGKKVQAADIVPMLEKVDKTVEAVFRDETHSSNFKFGRNRLLLGVIKNLVIQMLEIDMANAPIELIGLEQELEAIIPTPRHPQGVKLRGFVDRVDRVAGKTRIIDYKTGKVDTLRVSNFIDLHDGRPLKEVFQLGSYAFLYHKNFSPDRAVYPGIYGMRNLQRGLMMLEYGPQKIGDFDLMSLSEFEGLLQNLFEDLLNPEKPFVQTEDENRCKFCAYKVICNRK